MGEIASGNHAEVTNHDDRLLYNRHYDLWKEQEEIGTDTCGDRR